MIASIAAAMLIGSLLQAAASQPNDSAAPQPVHWAVKSAPSKPVGQGGRFQVELQARIDPGWHLYALQEPAGGPTATEIALPTAAAADLLRDDQGKPRPAIDPQSHLLTNYFEGNATFTLRLQANRTAAAGSHTLHVSVRYQTCNDRVCLAPRRDSLDVPLQIGQ